MSIEIPTSELQATEEAPAEEAQAEAPQETPAPQTPRATEALRTLMDRESKVREAEQALKQRERDIEESQRLAQLAKNNPLHFLDHVGVSVEDVTQKIIAGERPDPTASIRSEVQQLRDEINARQHREEAQQRQAALDEAKGLVTDFINTSEQYPLTKAAGMQDLVFQRIYDHHNETGQTLSEVDAAKQVEDYLSGVVDKLSSLDSIRNRFGGQEPVTAGAQANDLASTLTNAHSSANPTRKNEDSLSHSESLKRAAAMLQFVNNT